MRPTILTALASLLLSLVGCGSSGTETVSVSSQARPATSTSATRAASTNPAPAPATTGSTAANTRTQTAPAFTKQSTGEEGLTQAVAIVKAHGYTPNDTSDYHPDQTLRVLVATRTGSGDGYAQQAFFFLDGRYLGTDTSAPSAAVKVVAQGDTEVTLGYMLYRPQDPLCCARGGEARVRFALDNGHLAALDPIPPASSKTGTSRQ